MTWFALRVKPRRERDAVLMELAGGGTRSVEEDGPAFRTHYAARSEAVAAADAVRRLDPEASCDVEPVAEVDWSSAWRQGMRAFALGGLTVAPPWLSAGLDPARAVVIEPGMGFGTGDHASTRGAVRLLAAAAPDGARVVDLGTGSGVLAIAAARLGAARVVAVELDPDAFVNANDNIARNGVGDRVFLVEGDAAILLPLVGPADVITANILTPVILDLLSGISNTLTPTGRAVLAGIEATDRNRVLGAVSLHGLRLVHEDHEEGWWSGLIGRA